MSKLNIGPGVLAGIFLGIFFKTGIDASPEGISLMILEALSPLMPNFPMQLVVLLISIIGIVVLVQQLRDDVEFLVGFALGVFAVLISY